jgi:hypothetical protein
LGMKLPVQWKYAAAAAGLVLLVILVMDFNRRLESMNRRDEQLAAVRAEGTRVMQTQEALMTQVAYAGSDAAAAEWAYDSGQAKSGETLIQIIPGGGATPTVTPPPVEAATGLPNWQVWWELFFGG